MEDKRFVHIKTDPKFRRIPKGERRVKIDKRFQSMFKDKQFKVKYTSDKRGRPVSHTSTEDLKRYYELNSEEEEEEEKESGIEEPGKYVRKPKPEDVSEDEDEDEELNKLDVKHKSDKNVPEEIRGKLLDLNVDYARGESTLFSESSSDDEESEEEQSDSETVDHKWGELDVDAEKTEEATHRLAACNMDWDRIRAVDLLVLFNSFIPPGGLIESVIIYPSEFGKQRMKEEDIKGPTELVESKQNENNIKNEENEEGSKYHMEKLRQYQLNRLKYYYAVVTCNNSNTANKIYTECDGMEYESSATKIDLRFIPDDMTFDDEPKEVCNKLPEVNKYQPRFFTTKALQQAKVDLTWDETNPDRVELAQKLSSGKIDDVTDADLQSYLAPSSGEDSEDDKSDNISDNESLSSVKNPIDKYKALLQEIENQENEKKNKDFEMEITWGLDLKEKTEKLVNKKISESQNKTPFEQYVEKRKEKRKEKRDLRKKQTEGDSDCDIPSDIDMNDPYFAEEFKTNEFKRSKAKKEKIKSNVEDEDTAKQAELALLLMNEDDDDKKHFSLKKIQKDESKGKSKKKWKNKKNDKVNESEVRDDDFKINVGDERFSALFTSHHYNIDPTDPHYKNTKGMETLISEKIKRRSKASGENDTKKMKTEGKKDAELSVLVKSIKRKTQAFKDKR